MNVLHFNYAGYFQTKNINLVESNFQIVPRGTFSKIWHFVELQTCNLVRIHSIYNKLFTKRMNIFDLKNWIQRFIRQAMRTS